MPPVVTFTTDFGTRDSFVGIMKGVVLSRCPDAQLVDLTHEVPPQQIRTGALRLASAAPFFTAGTVHLVVVDPGVGSERRAIAIAAHGQRFVGPDNGVLSLAARPGAADWRAVELTESSFWQPIVSTTFHGRDIFAPIAGELARGVPFESIGKRIGSIVTIDLPGPRRSGNTIEGIVLDIDRFGNLATNIGRTDLYGLDVVGVAVGDARLTALSQTYNPARRLVALINSDDWLEIAAPLASAAELLHVGIDSPVRVEVRPRRSGRAEEHTPDPRAGLS
jgi:S-adenosylmethionine hydrolase